MEKEFLTSYYPKAQQEEPGLSVKERIAVHTLKRSSLEVKPEHQQSEAFGTGHARVFCGWRVLCSKILTFHFFPTTLPTEDGFCGLIPKGSSRKAIYVDRCPRRDGQNPASETRSYLYPTRARQNTRKYKKGTCASIQTEDGSQSCTCVIINTTHRGQNRCNESSEVKDFQKLQS